MGGQRDSHDQNFKSLWLGVGLRLGMGNGAQKTGAQLNSQERRTTHIFRTEIIVAQAASPAGWGGVSPPDFSRRTGTPKG